MSVAVSPDALSGGFADAPVQAARAFRAALDAMARPGTVALLDGATPPAPLSVAAGVLVLTLVDGTTPLHLAGAHDCAAVRDWITFHTGAPLVAAPDAVFGLGTWAALLPLDRFPVGSPEYPDRSATLILEASGGVPVRLRGPGIETFAEAQVPDPAAMIANHALFPLGLDFLLTSRAAVVALPRSTTVETI